MTRFNIKHHMVDESFPKPKEPRIIGSRLTEGYIADAKRKIALTKTVDETNRDAEEETDYLLEKIDAQARLYPKIQHPGDLIFEEYIKDIKSVFRETVDRNQYQSDLPDEVFENVDKEINILKKDFTENGVAKKNSLKTYQTMYEYYKNLFEKYAYIYRSKIKILQYIDETLFKKGMSQEEINEIKENAKNDLDLIVLKNISTNVDIQKNKNFFNNQITKELFEIEELA